MTFQNLGLSAPILKAVEKLGYVEPTPVQEKVIPALLGPNTDLIALAQTGTGKTAAYGLPIIAKCEEFYQKEKNFIPRVLILCPTRELCLQIADDLQAFSQYVDGVQIIPVYGGTSIEAQIKILNRGVNIIVATPGRLIDLQERGVADLSNIEYVILDEADEMLNMGFSESLETILASVPERRHLLLFSATMSKEIRTIAEKAMFEPKEIVIGKKNVGNQNIRHFHYIVSAKHKYLALKRIADFYPDIYGIIFCRTRNETKEIAEKLINDGYNAEALHGELSQAQRDYVMQKFRLRAIRLLVATDVAARGLDVDDLSHVIHYGLPDEIESYTHRSGRTARAGKSGISIAICHSREKNRLKDIEKIINAKIDRAFIPSAKAICEKQLYNHADRIERLDLEVDDRLTEILPGIVKKLSWIERDDLVRRMLQLEAGRILDYYQSAEEIEEADEKGRMPRAFESNQKKGRKKSGEAEPGMSRLKINFGKRDKFFPNKLIDLINHHIHARVDIGKIDLFRSECVFDVEQAAAQDVIDALNGTQYESRKIAIGFYEKIAEKDRPQKRNTKGGQTSVLKSQTRPKNNPLKEKPKKTQLLSQEDELWLQESLKNLRKSSSKKKGDSTEDKEPFYSKFKKK